MAEKYVKVSECEKYFYEHLDDNSMIGAMNAINEMPEADVVEVVRCKDCIHVDNGYIGHLYCRFFNSMPVSGMDYCKWGKQKAAASEKEVPVKRGHWINENFYTRCSVCGNMAIYDKYGQEVESDYCPRCGARMDGGEQK